MSNMLAFLILCVVVPVCSIPFWRIETSPPAYLLGTIHIPSGLVWPYVPEEIRQAFLASTDVFTEVDSQSASYWEEFLVCVTKRYGRTTRSLLSKSTLDILDAYLAWEARRLNKTVGGLEPAEYNCRNQDGRINLETWTLGVSFIRRNLEIIPLQIDHPQRYWRKPLVRRYLCDGLSKQFLKPLTNSTKDLRELEQRDEYMSDYMHTLLQYTSTRRYFFAIGAGHMLSDHKNVLFHLKSFGYRVTRIDTNPIGEKNLFGCKRTRGNSTKENRSSMPSTELL